MTYKLIFTEISNKEWNKLEFSIKTQFKKKLNERLENPKIKKDKISGYKNIYKIKLRSAGYRLIYEVKDNEIIVLVLTVSKRENDDIYKNLEDIAQENG
ncbi:MAG: type II toxin-antitoxin system RelE/ParE family toxin [Campylobacterota bacterium]|nr:type II toxin-antitoxin system RelE/ParE family toxin [Campylobacterota bacterium]